MPNLIQWVSARKYYATFWPGGFSTVTRLRGHPRSSTFLPSCWIHSYLHSLGLIHAKSFPHRGGSGRATRARASYTLGLAAICACSPWPWGHVAPSGKTWSGAPVGKRAALRRAWRGVGRGAMGRECEDRRVERAGGAVWGDVHPLRVPAQTRAEPPWRHFSSLPVGTLGKEGHGGFLLAGSREPVAWPPLSQMTWAAAQRL